MTKEITVSDETYEKIKDQITENAYEQKSITAIDDMIGGKWFFRTVTYHILGRVTGVINGKILCLEDASWIADSGRFMEFIKKGTASEVEPIGQHYINLDTVTDFTPWKHELLTDQK